MFSEKALEYIASNRALQTWHRLKDSEIDVLKDFAEWLDERAAQQSFAADETIRLRDLLWVGCLCGACGHSYKYNRADDPKGEKGHEEHLLAYPDCPSSRR
jgi:hypothetical protein